MSYEYQFVKTIEGGYNRHGTKIEDVNTYGLNYRESSLASKFPTNTNAFALIFVFARRSAF